MKKHIFTPAYTIQKLISFLLLAGFFSFLYLVPTNTVLALPVHTIPGTLKITTWNLEWFTDKPANHPLLAEGVYPKSPQAIAELVATRKKLSSDVIAFQEADDSSLLYILFPSDDFTVILSHEENPIAQHVGIAVKKSIPFIHYPDVPLAINSLNASHFLRNGVDISIKFNNTWLRILAIHLKSGCWDAPFTSSTHSCPLLRQQSLILGQWITDREQAHEPYIILGDFNRRLSIHDEFFNQLTSFSPLFLTTQGLASPCQGGEYFIDHILTGTHQNIHPIPESLTVALYPSVRLKNPNLTSNNNNPSPSDHCPVSILLKDSESSPH